MGEENKSEVEEEQCGVGADIGTSNIVVTRRNTLGVFISKFHRNMLYKIGVSDEAEDLLCRGNYLYVKYDGSYYIVGEEALKLVNAIGSGEIIRPMEDGLINPSLKAGSELLFFIIKSVVGDPKIEKEPIRFSCPGNPINSKGVNNIFHSKVLEGFFFKMGYDPRSLNEAMAVSYDTPPKMITNEGEVPLSGISISFGGGMINVALCYKGLELNSFSITKSGDEIDRNVAQVTGISKNKVIVIKEKKLNLSSVDFSDRVQSALSIYYDEMIDRVFYYISREFVDKKSDMDGNIDIVIAGGTSCPIGFNDRLESAIKRCEFPFKVNSIRSATEKFYSVSRGCCIRAIADWKKNMNKK